MFCELSVGSIYTAYAIKYGVTHFMNRSQTITLPALEAWKFNKVVFPVIIAKP